MKNFLKLCFILTTGVFISTNSVFAKTITLDVNNEGPAIDNYSLNIQIKKVNDAVVDQTIKLDGLTASTNKTYSVDVGDLNNLLGPDNNIPASNLVLTLMNGTTNVSVVRNTSGSVDLSNFNSISLKTNGSNAAEFKMNVPPSTTWDSGTAG